MNDLIFLCEQTAVLLEAGMPLSQALTIIQSRSPRRLEVKLQETVKSLEAGLSFSEALEKNGLLKNYLASLQIAERDGQLTEALLQAAQQMRKNQNFQENLKRSLAYPSIIMGTSVLCLFFLIFVILPTFSQLFSDFSMPLPPLTRLMVMLPKFWPIFMTGLAGSLFFIYRLWVNPDLRLKIPWLKEITGKLTLSAVCHTLSQQIQAGVPILTGLESTLYGVKIMKIKTALRGVKEGVEGGQSLAEALSKFKIFPSFMVQMAMVGEQSGTLGKMLNSAGELFEVEAEQALKKVTICIEPAATLIIGAAVGFIALAMMMPLFSLMNTML